jgi:1,4-dihydroxy-2-naphthoate octaprenyltransferase
MQSIIIVAMLVCFVLIGQKASAVLYSVGLSAIIIITLCNMAFSNMRPDLNFKDAMIAFVRIMAIVAIIFVLGILLAPVLINMGKRG